MSSQPGVLELLIRQREAWQRGERCLVERLLEANPEIGQREDAILDLIYQEIVLREEQGESATLEEYVQRFPHLEGPLRIQFEVERALQQESIRAVPPRAALAQLADCEILEEIGRGAMGIVYRGWQTVMRRVVAVKVLSLEVSEGRFRAEAITASRLIHPHVVQLYEVKEFDGRPALIFEYVEGGNLAQKLQGKPQSPHDSARLVKILAETMEIAHQRGVIHRDLKPSNVLLTGNADDPLRTCSPKIGDFGVAKFLEGRARLTLSNELLGTPSYVAPEQIGDAATIDVTADVYSLGAILYECLTGRPPFLGQTILATLEQVRNDDPLPPSRLQRVVPRDLEIICLKCLEKKPGRRYSSAGALASDLANFLEGKPISVRAMGVLEWTWNWARRHPTIAVSSLAFALALLALLAGGFWANHVLRQERDLARENSEQLGHQLDRTRRLLYTAQLLRVCALWESDPAQGLRMLDDPLACPTDLRCFSWAILRGRCKPYRAAIRGLESPVRSLVHYPRGQLVVTGDASGKIRFWDAASRQMTALLDEHDASISAMAITPDGLTLATGDDSGVVCLWDMPGGVRRSRFHCKSRVADLAWHPEGKTLFVAAGRFTVWDVSSARPRDIRASGVEPIVRMTLNREGEVLATLDQKNRLRLLDVATLQPLDSLPLLGESITAMAFLHDGQRIVMGSQEGFISIWDLRTKKRKEHLDAGVGPIASLALHPEEFVVAVVGDDRERAEVVLWDVSRLKVPPRRIRSGAFAVTFAPDGQALLSSGRDLSLKWWDYPPRREEIALPDHTGFVLAKRQPLLASIDDQSNVVLTDLITGEERRTLRAQGRRVRALALSPRGRLVAAAVSHPGEPVELLIWDTTSGKLLQVMRVQAVDLVGLAFSDDEQRIVSATRSGDVRLWDVSSGQQTRSFGDGIPPLHSISWRGDRVVAVGAGLIVWNVSQGYESERFALLDESRHLALSSDGRVAALVIHDAVHRIDLDTGVRLDEIKVHLNQIHQLALSDDGQTFAVAGSASGVKLWDVATAQERASLPGHFGGARFVAFGESGVSLVTASESGIVRLWYATAGDPP